MNISSDRLVGIELKRAKKVRQVIIKYKFLWYFVCFFFKFHESARNSREQHVAKILSVRFGRPALTVFPFPFPYFPL